MLSVLNARVYATRTRPCCPQTTLTTLTKRVACIKRCSVRSVVHFDCTCKFKRASFLSVDLESGWDLATCMWLS